MNNKLIRFYNQNRHIIWLVIITVIGVIALMQILNNFVAQKELQEYQENQGYYNNIENKTDNNYMVITGKKINKATSNIIDYFIDFCNEGDYKNAYELLSDDCKNVLYPDLQGFKENYYDKIFNTKKLCSYQAIINNGNCFTYQVRFSEDILTTRKNNRINYCRLLYNNY